MVDVNIKYTAESEDYEKGADKVIKKTKEAERAVDSFGNELNKLNKEINKAGNELGKGAKAHEISAQKKLNEAKATKKVANEYEYYNKQLKKTEADNKKLISSIEKRYNQEIKTGKFSRQTYMDTSDAVESYTASLKNAERMVMTYRDEKKKLRKVFRDSEKAQREAAATLMSSEKKIKEAMHLTYHERNLNIQKSKEYRDSVKKAALAQYNARKEYKKAAGDSRSARVELEHFVDTNEKSYKSLSRKVNVMKKVRDGLTGIHNASAKRLEKLTKEIAGTEAYNKTLKKQADLLSRLSQMEKTFKQRGQFDLAAQAEKTRKQIRATEQTGGQAGERYGFYQGPGDALMFDSKAEMEKHIKNVNKMEKAYKKLNKRVRRGTGFLNGWFGRLSIIMSGTAATIFVFQNIGRLIGAIAAPLLEMEKAFIKMKSAIAVSSEELGEYEKSAEKASRAGYQSVEKNIERLTELREKGYSAAQAMALLRRESELYEQASDGTVTAELSKFIALVKELATVTFEAFSDEFKALLGFLNRSLEIMIKMMEQSEKTTQEIVSSYMMLSTIPMPANIGVTGIPNVTNTLDNKKSNFQSYGPGYQMYATGKSEVESITIEDSAYMDMVEQQKITNDALKKLVEHDKKIEEEAKKEAEYKAALSSALERFQKVEKVIDGDTFKIKPLNEEFSVRVRGIDTPESTANIEERPKDSWGRDVKNVPEGLLAKHFMKLMSGVSGGFTLKNVGKDKYDRTLADVFMKSGFNIAPIMAELGIGQAADYDKKILKDMVKPSEIDIKGTELSASAVETLRLEMEKLKKFSKERGIKLDVTKDEDPENWKKVEMVFAELAHTYFDLASLTGKVSIKDFLRAQQKELQNLTTRMEAHKKVLAESGIMTNQYAKDMDSLVQAQKRANVEAGVDVGIAEDIADLQTFEDGLTKTLSHIGTFSEKRIEYEEKAAEESLKYDDQYWDYRIQKAKNEGARIEKYAGDASAKIIHIDKERIEKIKAQTAKDQFIFGYTNQMKESTIQLLRDAANIEASIVEEKTKDERAALLFNMLEQIKISEMGAAHQKEVFEKTGVATQEFVDQQSAIINDWAEYYIEKTDNMYAGEKYLLEANLALFKEIYASRLKEYEAFYDETGSMTLDHYAYLKTIIEQESIKMVIDLEMQGLDKKGATAIAEATKNMRLINLEVKNLRNSSNLLKGFAMGINDVTEATRSAAEAMYDLGLSINDTFKQSLKDGLSNFMKTGTFDIENVLSGFLDSFLDSWSDAMIDMAVSWITKDKTILAAEKAMAAEVIAIDKSTQASILASQKATSDAVIALKIAEKEMLVALDAEIIAAKEMGITLEESAAQTSAAIQIAASEAVKDAQIANSNEATAVSISNSQAQAAAAQSAAAASNAATASTGWGIAVVAIGMIASKAYQSFTAKDKPDRTFSEVMERIANNLQTYTDSLGMSRDKFTKELTDNLTQYSKRVEESNKRLERIALADTTSQWLEAIKEVLDDSNKRLEEIRDEISVKAGDIYGRQIYQEYRDSWNSERDKEEPINPEPIVSPRSVDTVVYSDGVMVTKDESGIERIISPLGLGADGGTGPSDGSSGSGNAGIGTGPDDGGYDVDFGSPSDGLGEPDGPDIKTPPEKPMSYNEFLRMHPEIDQMINDMRNMGLYALRDKLTSLFEETGNAAYETLINQVQVYVDEFEDKMAIINNQIMDSITSFANQWLNQSTQYEKDMADAQERFLEGITGFGEAVETYFDALDPEKLKEYGVDIDAFKNLVMNSGTVEGAQTLYMTVLTLAEQTGDTMLMNWANLMGDVAALAEETLLAINQAHFERRGDTWDSIDRYWQKLTETASDLDQELWSVNDQFDSWKEALKDSGAQLEELTKLEYLRQKALELTILQYELEQVQAGKSGIEALIERFRNMAEAQITKDFTVEDWVNIIYRAGNKLELLDKDTYEDVADYWEDVVELSTLQLDALDKIIDLTEQEIGALEQSMESIENMIDRFQGGDLDPVQSAEYYNQRYASLQMAAMDPGASAAQVQEFIDFIPDYVDFMKQFGYDYAKMVEAILQDLEEVKDQTRVTLENLHNDLLSIVGGIVGLGETMEDIIGLRLQTLIEYADTNYFQNALITDLLGQSFGESGPVRYIANILNQMNLNAINQTNSLISAIQAIKTEVIVNIPEFNVLR
jgi:endonuclease YncB( thermonuclease family)